MDGDNSLIQLQKQQEALAKAVAEITPMISEIRQELRMGPHRDFSTREVAAMTGKAEFTVREWCRKGRIKAKKSTTHCGPNSQWIIPLDSYRYLRRVGLLPISH